MKKIAISLLLLLSANAFAASAKLQGFVGLNLLDYTKISDEDATAGTGFDMFTATISGKRDEFSAKMKLNLDLSKDDLSGDRFHLFEEVNVTYNYEDMIYVTVGKGVLPFHSFHYGALRPYLVDGGTFYDHSTFRPTHFRHDEGVLLSTVKYASEEMGLTNEFSFFGRDVSQDKDSYYEEETEKTFKISQQRGFANKLTWKANQEHKLTASAKWFKNDYAPEATVAGHLFYEFTGESWNIWTGYLYGQFYSNNEEEELRSETYHVGESKEHIFQAGAEYDFSELMNFYVNLEYYNTADREYKKTVKGYWSNDLDGTKTTTSARVEAGTKFKMAKDTFVNVGVIHERNEVKFSALDNTKKSRYSSFSNDSVWKTSATSGLATLSYWF